jgi:hypothetical protein
MSQFHGAAITSGGASQRRLSAIIIIIICLKLGIYIMFGIHLL